MFRMNILNKYLNIIKESNQTNETLFLYDIFYVFVNNLI